MNTDEEKIIDLTRVKNSLGVRHQQAALMFFALILAYGMRVNMSMAIVVMTDTNNVNSFDWSIQTQSVILSSFFWGYIVLQIPGGELATRFGGSLLITLCIALNAIVSMFIPYCAYFGGWQLVCACRVLQGITQGCVVPSIQCLIGKWAPVEEKSRIGAFVHSGSQLGNAIQLLAAGYIANFWGWPAIFYVNGAAGAIWTVAYVFLGSDSPETSKRISSAERLYIQTSLGQIGQQKKLKTPWKAIWTSVPFWSLILLHCCQNWGFWTLMTEMPSYMKLVLGVDIKQVVIVHKSIERVQGLSLPNFHPQFIPEPNSLDCEGSIIKLGPNGAMSALPYLVMYLLSFPFGYLTDYLPNKKWLSVTATRKLSNSIGIYGPAIALIGLSYTPSGNILAALLLLTLVVGLNVGHITGLMLVHLDMSPNFAGILLGITNCAANIVSIIAPLVAGAVLKDETDPEEWRKVFYIASAVYITGNTLYLIFGTSEKQKWDDPDYNAINNTCTDSESQNKN